MTPDQQSTNPDCACAGRNKDGTPCLRNARYGQVCWQHMPPHRQDYPHPGFENCEDPAHFETHEFVMTNAPHECCLTLSDEEHTCGR